MGRVLLQSDRLTTMVHWVLEACNVFNHMVSQSQFMTTMHPLSHQPSYNNGTLGMYTVHAIKPNSPQLRPEYHIHQDQWMGCD